MRTTILLDDDLVLRFRETARIRGQSLGAFLADAGRAAIGSKETPAPPFRLITEKGSGVHPGIDLDKTGALLAAEDERRHGAGA